jgi:hypothetical protein
VRHDGESSVCLWVILSKEHSGALSRHRPMSPARHSSQRVSHHLAHHFILDSRQRPSSSDLGFTCKTYALTAATDPPPPLPRQADSPDELLYLRRLLVLTVLAELHTAAVLSRELLVLTGYLQPHPVDAELLQLDEPWKGPRKGRRRGLAVVVWSTIWLTFFICQCLPFLYFLVHLTSQFVVLGLLFGQGTSPTVWGTLAAVAVAAMLNFARMKSLSERFQLDFWKTHHT